MINIEIQESDDYDSIGEYRFEYPSISIGTKVKSNIRLFDSSVSTPILIKVIDNDKAVLIHNSKKGFLCNSKRYYFSTILKSGDIIEYEKLQFIIKSISSEGKFPKSLKAHRKELLKEIQGNNSALLEVLEAIEDDILNLGVV